MTKQVHALVYVCVREGGGAVYLKNVFAGGVNGVKTGTCVSVCYVRLDVVVLDGVWVYLRFTEWNDKRWHCHLSHLHRILISFLSFKLSLLWIRCSNSDRIFRIVLLSPKRGEGGKHLISNWEPLFVCSFSCCCCCCCCILILVLF